MNPLKLASMLVLGLLLTPASGAACALCSTACPEGEGTFTYCTKSGSTGIECGAYCPPPEYPQGFAPIEIEEYLDLEARPSSQAGYYASACSQPSPFGVPGAWHPTPLFG